MERSEETLSTRDLAQANEPATDRDAVAASTGGPEGGAVYDQEREGQAETAGTPPAGQPTGISAAGQPTGIENRADEGDPSGAVALPDVDGARAVGADESPVGAMAAQDRAGTTTPSAVGTERGSTTGQDNAVAPEQMAAGGSRPVAGGAATDTTGAAAAGAGTPGAGAAAETTGGSAGDSAPLLSAEASSSFQRRWDEVQTRFVDQPRGAVEEADGLVANLMQQLAEGFAQERERLEAQWDRGEDISTEDLRVALQRYRSFFQRLLSA